MLSWEAARFSQEGGWYVRLIWGLSKGRPYPVQQSISFRRVKSKQMNAVPPASSQCNTGYWLAGRAFFMCRTEVV
jgi:hypothetical protein